MHQEANNINNSVVTQLVFEGNQSPETIEAILSHLPNANIQFNNDDKLNKIYKKFGDIVNSFDASFYISSVNKEVLKSSIDQMEMFEDDFAKDSDNGRTYYNNLLVLLFRFDKQKFIEKYKTVPEYVKNEVNNRYLYSVALYDLGEKELAFDVIDDILNEFDDERYIIQKGFYLFVDGNIKELKKLLVKANRKNDELGYYGVFDLEVLYSRLHNLKVLKRLNSKYKNKPLYHLRMAEIIYEIDKSNEKDIKDNIKLAFSNIKESDLLSLMKLIDTANRVNQQEYFLKLITAKKYSSEIINSMLLDMLISKKDIDENDVSRIEALKIELNDSELIDIDIVDAVLSLKRHKELEAIDFFNKSFKKNKSLYAARNLINLVLKNNDTRNMDSLQTYINVLNKSNISSDFILISSAYMFLDDTEMALEYLFMGVISSADNYDYYMRFWAIHAKSKIEKMEINNVNNDCVIELSNSSECLKICMDKKIQSLFNISSFHGIKFNKDRDFEISVLGKSVGDTVLYAGKKFTIKSIKHKYDSLLDIIFPKIKNGSYFKPITTADGDDPLKGIKEFLKEQKDVMDKKFDAYDLEISKGPGLPLSFFVYDEGKTFRDILLTLLFTNNKYKLFAGEINELCKEKIAIDITSLVLLEQFDLLEKLETIKDKIYITQSTINAISKSFNYYLKNDEEALSICIDDNGELRKQEMTKEDNKKLQEFWRSILEISSKFNIVNHEAALEKDSLEACQIDTIDYSVNNECVLVTEDLLLRKFANSINQRVESTTNFLGLVEKICDDPNVYINLICTLARGKYVYCINEMSFLNMMRYALDNHEVQEKITDIIDCIFETEFLYNIYFNIVYKVLLYMYYYENIKNIKFYNSIIEQVIKYCEKYNNRAAVVVLDKYRL